MEKRCALIRQTWYESAKKNLKVEQRLMFYEMCFEYEFYNIEPNRAECPFESSLLMFDMVRDNLDQDREKAESIAMRNRRNGMKGGRPKQGENGNPNETQKNPENPNGFFGSPLHNTTQHNTTQHFSFYERHTDIEKYTKFLVCLYFFRIGAINPIAETDKFYNFYTARGWMVGKETPIKDKVAMAKNWRVENIMAQLIENRTMYAQLLESIDAEDIELIADYHGFRWNKNQFILSYVKSNRCPELLESKRYLKRLQSFLISLTKSQGIEDEPLLTYRVIPEDAKLL